MTRICMILNNFEIPFGGPELQAQKIATALMERGHRVFIITRGSGKAPTYERLGELDIVRLNKRGLASVELFWQLLKYRNDFDVIHVHGVGRLSSVAIRFAKRFDKQVYIKVTTAGHLFKKPQSKLKELFQTVLPFREQKLTLLKKADGMIAISSEIRNELVNNGFPLPSIYDIPNGVDMARFHPVSIEERNQLRSKLGLPMDRRIFVYSGKLTRRKGIDTLMTAWSKAAHMKETGMLVMLGSGLDQQDGMETYIQNSIKEHNLDKTVAALGDVDNVADYLQSADVFLFPSRREGLPNSLLEAMACGLLCVASDIGGNRDLITSGQNGYLVAPEDVDQWCKQLENVAVNVAESLREAAASSIRDNYDLKITVDRLENLFNIKNIARNV